MLRNLVTRYPNIDVVVFILGVIVMLSWVVRGFVLDAERRMEGRLKGLETIFKNIQTLPYVYGSAPAGIDIMDKSVADWKDVHDDTVKQGRLRAQLSKNDGWLDVNFTDDNRQGTPKTKNRQGTPKTKIRELVTPYPYYETKPNFKLRFAHDHADKLYVLGHLDLTSKQANAELDKANTDVDGLDSLRLIVHRNQPGIRVEETFDISIENNENNENNGILRTTSANISGTWWKSEQNWFFELALEIGQFDALVTVVELIASEKKDDPNGYQIEIAAPLPKLYEKSEYTTDKYLSVLASRYAVHKLDDDRLLVRVVAPADGREATEHPFSLWLPSLLYRFYFIFDRNIKLCPNDSPRESGSHSTCFLREGGYRLRGHGPGGVLTEERLPVDFGRASVPAFLAIILLVSLTYYVEREFRRAFRESEQANAELDKANNELERINEGIRSYVDTSLHEARRFLDRIRREARQIAAGDRSGVERIENLVPQIIQRLWDSTEKFHYEKTVREAIENAHELNMDKFDLSGSIGTLVDSFLGEVENIEFQTLYGEDHRLFLSAAKPRGIEQPAKYPDYYISQALRKVIENADERRKPKNSTINIQLDVAVDNGLPHAVLTVSNEGPTVPESKLEDVYKLGHRYDGATSSAKDHQGLGLFLTREIISAYGGNCRLENLADNTGVVVTLRFPVELRAADPHHRSPSGTSDCQR